MSIYPREKTKSLRATIHHFAFFHMSFLSPRTQVDFRQLCLNSEVLEIHSEMKVGLFLKIRRVYYNMFQEGFATAKAAALQFSLCFFILTDLPIATSSCCSVIGISEWTVNNIKKRGDWGSEW